MSKKKFGNFGAKGYYIALVLCAAAIGVSAYLYYRNAEPQANVPAAVVEEVELPAAAPGEEPAAESTEAPTRAVTRPSKPLKTAAPVNGEVVAEYSMECLSYNATTRDWRVHGGTDYAAEAGSPVTAAADGEVYTVYEDAQMGMTVVIRHDGGYTTHYASLSEQIPVSAGDQVKLGQTIGYVGATALMESALGDHVCFRVTCEGDVVDPAEFFD